MTSCRGRIHIIMVSILMIIIKVIKNDIVMKKCIIMQEIFCKSRRFFNKRLTDHEEILFR